MRELARRLEQVPPDEYLSLDDRETVSCDTCGDMNTQPRYPGCKREVALFCFAQGSPKIEVYDWYCDKCNERRIFTGKNSGVFLKRKKICYTTELMYLLLDMTYGQAFSFRTAYRITRLFESSPEIARRRMKYETSSLGDEGNRSRIRTNKEFRAFVKHLNTISACIAEKLYSCHTGEVPLSPQDCEELKIDPSSATGMKRFKAFSFTVPRHEFCQSCLITTGIQQSVLPRKKCWVDYISTFETETPQDSVELTENAERSSGEQRAGRTCCNAVCR